jgi:hypothetical protein
MKKYIEWHIAEYAVHWKVCFSNIQNGCQVAIWDLTQKAMVPSESLLKPCRFEYLQCQIRSDEIFYDFQNG